MKDLRSTAAFFRCSLSEAVRFATDRDVQRDVFEWYADRLFTKASPW